MSFDELVAQAEAQPFEGWDFSWIADRVSLAPTSWDYPARVGEELRHVTSFVDLGTGGGEFVATLEPLPRLSVATESYPPNVTIAASRLKLRGVHVVWPEGAPDNDRYAGPPSAGLPFKDDAFDLVIDRHESFWPCEVFRVLRPGGLFITQQVGGHNDLDLVALLTDDPPPPGFGLDIYMRQLPAAGFEIVDARDERPEHVFLDVGAIVYHLNAIPWQLPGFSAAAYREPLHRLHDRIAADGRLVVHAHRLFVEARKPA